PSVVVKAVLPEHPSAAALAADLRREHELLAPLRLPGVAQALGLIEIGALPALVLVDAGPVNLATWLRRRALSPEVFLDLAIQLAETLARLHDHGILHRDVNPTNVVVGPDDRLTLVDLGAATPLVGPGLPAHPHGS